MYVDFLFFNDTATTEIYTLSLRDALPISPGRSGRSAPGPESATWRTSRTPPGLPRPSPNGSSEQDGCRSSGQAARSEEHTSEFQSRQYLACRLLLETKQQLCADLAATRSV